MEFNSLLNSRSKKEQYMIFMGSFLVIFYLFYLSWGYFDKLYFKALMRYENELNSYLSTNLPTQIQNQIELADKKLQNNKYDKYAKGYLPCIEIVKIHFGLTDDEV